MFTNQERQSWKWRQRQYWSTRAKAPNEEEESLECGQAVTLTPYCGLSEFGGEAVDLEDLARDVEKIGFGVI